MENLSQKTSNSKEISSTSQVGYDVLQKSLVKSTLSENKEKMKFEGSTLANTVTSSVHGGIDNDIAVDSEIKTENKSKSFKDSLEKTKELLKANEFTLDKNLPKISNFANNSKDCSETNSFSKKYLQKSLKNKEALRDQFSNEKEEIICSLDDFQESQWNQFDDNEKLFKIKSSYSENQYNPKINFDTLPDQIKKTAEKIERELKLNKSKSTHINEERGIILSDEENEEAKYSSVVRKSKKENKNKQVSSFSNKNNKTTQFSLWKFLVFIGISLILFISYRLHKISQKKLALLNTENEDIENEVVIITSDIDYDNNIEIDEENE